MKAEWLAGSYFKVGGCEMIGSSFSYSRSHTQTANKYLKVFDENIKSYFNYISIYAYLDFQHNFV